MAKKTRKALKQESQQRAIQQAVANVSTEAAAPAASAPAAPVRAAKVELEEQQEFAYVKSDVRRSLTLAGIFAAVMIVLSFIVR
jgi:predicted neutral ceramidase superfamily lipid hydrolase